jgi:hypothetical protein
MRRFFSSDARLATEPAPRAGRGAATSRRASLARQRPVVVRVHSSACERPCKAGPFCVLSLAAGATGGLPDLSLANRLAGVPASDAERRETASRGATRRPFLQADAKRNDQSSLASPSATIARTWLARYSTSTRHAQSPATTEPSKGHPPRSAGRAPPRAEGQRREPGAPRTRA